MAVKYNIIEIFTSEEAKYNGTPLYDAVLQYIYQLKIAGRCTVIRGIQGLYENGEISTQSILDISLNMPIMIKIILPSAQIDTILPTLENMIGDGIMGISEMNVYCHKTQKKLIPRHLKVKDIMTPHPKTVQLDTPVSDVVTLLLSSSFTGVPVIDKNDEPIGVISQGDLIYRSGIPVRIGILAGADQENIDAVLSVLSAKTAKDIMTQPAVSIKENDQVTNAVHRMLSKELKRLVVIDEQGKLTGILSRIDIFRTISKESPDWDAIRKQNIFVDNIRFVSDIMRRDTHTVLVDTPVKEILRMIDTNDIQRVAVVDHDGRFLGLISDRNLLAAFYDHRQGVWEYLTSKLLFGKKSRLDRGLVNQIRQKKAADVMKTNPITIMENATIDEAIRLMTEKVIKRLPVIDSEGKFKGMVSRESVLRAGFLSA